MPTKSAKQIKEELIILIQSYINVSKKQKLDEGVEQYFRGYTAGMENILEQVEKIDVGEEDVKKEEKKKDDEDSKITYL